MSDEYSDSCNKSRHLLKLLEEGYVHPDHSTSTTESDHSPNVQTAIYCKKLDSAADSSSDQSQATD